MLVGPCPASHLTRLSKDTGSRRLGSTRASSLTKKSARCGGRFVQYYYRRTVAKLHPLLGVIVLYAALVVWLVDNLTLVKGPSRRCFSATISPKGSVSSALKEGTMTIKSSSFKRRVDAPEPVVSVSLVAAGFTCPQPIYSGTRPSSTLPYGLQMRGLGATCSLSRLVLPRRLAAHHTHSHDRPPLVVIEGPFMPGLFQRCSESWTSPGAPVLCIHVKYIVYRDIWRTDSACVSRISVGIRVVASSSFETTASNV